MNTEDSRPAVVGQVEPLVTQRPTMGATPTLGPDALKLLDDGIAAMDARAAELAAMRRDAARYRWLRDQHTYDGEGDSDITRWYVQAGREPVPCDPGALDTEIDAAMAAAAPGAV